MRVWRYSEVFYMERKRDLIISWRYASLAMNRGAIKRGFTVLGITMETVTGTHNWYPISSPKMPYKLLQLKYI